MDQQSAFRPLSTGEAAPYVGVAARTLENWRTLGLGPRFIKAGRNVVYDVRDIEAWKTARTVRSTSESLAA